MSCHNTRVPNVEAGVLHANAQMVQNLCHEVTFQAWKTVNPHSLYTARLGLSAHFHLWKSELEMIVWAQSQACTPCLLRAGDLLGQKKTGRQRLHR